MLSTLVSEGLVLNSYFCVAYAARFVTLVVQISGCADLETYFC